jgi:uncharacterized protein involved in exopolysaccharide biosynthesis
MLARTQRPIGLHELVQVLSRYRSRVLVWCLVTLGLSLLALVMLPRRYESEAKLFLRLGRESVTLDPTATTGTTIQVQESRENQINSTREMLKSRGLLERVVEKLGAETILKGSPDSAPSGISALLSGVMNVVASLNVFSPSVSPAELAVGKLSKSIDVTSARNSSVINIACTAKTAKLAQQIMQAFVDAYQEQHLAANRTAGSLEFFATQATELKQQLDAAISNLRDAKTQSSLVSIPVAQQALQSHVTEVEAAALAAASSLASSEASIASLRKALADLPANLTTQQTTGFPNVAADSMRQELFKAQISARDLEAKLGAEHPLVKIAREQLRQSEYILNAQSEERKQTTSGINPTRQSLELELEREEVLAASVRAKASALKEQSAELQTRMRTLNEQEVQITELERQTAIAEANYRSYRDHLEQARIGEALEANRISNVNVIQPPSLVERPVSPKPLLVLGVGFLIAVLGSLGLAFGSDHYDKSLKTAAEIESQLGVPVLGSIPRANGNHVLLNH